MLEMDTTTLMLSLVFGAIGMGLFMYGKKQMRLPHLAAGMALMVVPYFLPGAVSLTVVCSLLTALPFVLPV